METDLLCRGPILDRDFETAMDEVDGEIEGLTVGSALRELRLQRSRRASAGSEALHRFLGVPERTLAYAISFARLAAGAPQIRT